MQIPGNDMSFHFGQGFCARTRVTSSYLKTTITGNATRTRKTSDARREMSLKWYVLLSGSRSPKSTVQLKRQSPHGHPIRYA